MSNTFKWCGKFAPKASIPEIVQNMCVFLSGDGIKTLINKTIKEYLEANPINGFDIDKVFPIGSIYVTEDSSFDPVKEWGGTWQKLPDLSLLRQVGESESYYTGWDGSTMTASTFKVEAGKFQAGRAKYDLTSGNIPRHQHSYTARTFSKGAGTLRYASGSASTAYVTSVTSNTSNSYTGYYPSQQNPPSTIPIPLLETPTYGVIYWRRTA